MILREIVEEAHRVRLHEKEIRVVNLSKNPEKSMRSMPSFVKEIVETRDPGRCLRCKTIDELVEFPSGNDPAGNRDCHF